MNYVGVDIHKRYSVLVAVDERGWELARGRISGNSASGFAQFFAGLEGKSKVVVEACWNWGRIHDVLEEIEQEEVVLAHPLKTRLIADAQIKTDALDAQALATLLHGDLIAKMSTLLALLASLRSRTIGTTSTLALILQLDSSRTPWVLYTYRGPF
jgi:transposase